MMMQRTDDTNSGVCPPFPRTLLRLGRSLVRLGVNCRHQHDVMTSGSRQERAVVKSGLGDSWRPAPQPKCPDRQGRGDHRNDCEPRVPRQRGRFRDHPPYVHEGKQREHDGSDQQIRSHGGSDRVGGRLFARGVSQHDVAALVRLGFQQLEPGSPGDAVDQRPTIAEQYWTNDELVLVDQIVLREL